MKNHSKRHHARPRTACTETAAVTPFDDSKPARLRTETALELSSLAVRIATWIICHVIVEEQELLSTEPLATAHAILQRVTTTHLCNHKLTAEGITLEYDGMHFQLHEEYKTMTLTRSVYEHLATFYFLFCRPQTDAERAQVWDDWRHDIRPVPYSQAWRYLFRNRELAQMYHHLSVHSHPVCEGLAQYQSQDDTDQGRDCVPLHLSTCFLACLCSLYLQFTPLSETLLTEHFTQRELSLFHALAKLPGTATENPRSALPRTQGCTRRA